MRERERILSGSDSEVTQLTSLTLFVESCTRGAWILQGFLCSYFNGKCYGQGSVFLVEITNRGRPLSEMRKGHWRSDLTCFIKQCHEPAHSSGKMTRSSKTATEGERWRLEKKGNKYTSVIHYIQVQKFMWHRSVLLKTFCGPCSDVIIEICTAMCH